MPKGYDPADYVFLLPDWNGSVTKTFKAKNTDKAAAICRHRRRRACDGQLSGTATRPAALALVRKALNGG